MGDEDIPQLPHGRFYAVDHSGDRVEDIEAHEQHGPGAGNIVNWKGPWTTSGDVVTEDEFVGRTATHPGNDGGGEHREAESTEVTFQPEDETLEDRQHQL